MVGGTGTDRLKGEKVEDSTFSPVTLNSISTVTDEKMEVFQIIISCSCVCILCDDEKQVTTSDTSSL